jgi:steroid 5-alpha reductase family enzyme
MEREPTEPPPDDRHDPFPETRPFRRMQAATAILIAVAAALTLLSDSRPAAVRWGAAIGIAVLIVTIYVITRRRRPDG